MMKNWKCLLGVGLAVFLGGVVPGWSLPSQKNPFELHFGPQKDQSQCLDRYFIEFVDSAKKTLDGCFYELRIQNITDAFLRAKKRGVKIRLVTDTDNFENEWIKQLKDAGIEVHSDNNRSALMHNKFGIADGTRLWTGSFNLTDTCSYNNNNNGMCFYSPELSAIYQREFQEMFVEEKFGTTSPSDLEKQQIEIPIFGKKSLVQVFFAPEDNPNGHIAELLKTAKHEIFFMHFAFTADEIADLMIEKKKEGLKVAGIFDAKLYRSTGPYSEFFKLTNADVDIILADNPKGKFHHKVYFVDPHSPDGFVISGSENSSTNGDNSNDENVIVIHNQKVAKMFFEEFKKLFGTFSQSYATCVNFYVKPETKIDNVNMVFNANGKPVERIEITYPARWTLSGEEKVNVYRLDRKPLPKGSLKFFPKGFSVENTGLKAFGKSSYLVFNFNDLVAPKIKGGYNLYVRTSAAKTGKTNPIQAQPGIEVSDTAGTEKVQSFEELMRKMYLSYSELLKLQDSGMDAGGFEQLFAGWREHFKEITEMLLTEAKNGQYQKVDQFIYVYSTLDKPNKLKLAKFVKALTSVLRMNQAQGDAEAAKRLKAINGLI